MSTKLKRIIIAETILIIILISSLLYIVLFKANDNCAVNNLNGLLSPRVYSRVLEPKSFLIVNYAPLRSSFEDYIKKNNLTISVYIENLRNGASIGIDGTRGFPPASLNKVPTAILIMKKVEDGNLSLNSMIPIKDSLRSSSFGDLYLTHEKQLPLHVLMEQMLSKSDDTAFKILSQYEDPNDKAFLLSYLDYYSSGNTINLSAEGRETDLVSPKSYYNVFSSLYLSSLLTPKDSEYILSLLTNTTFN